MALTSNRVTVTTTPVALNVATPTPLRVWNIGAVTVFVGPTGAGNQKYPVESGEEAVLNIGASDIVFAVVASGTGEVAIFHG